MDGAKPPLQVAVDFIAHTKWHLLLHPKNQAICHKTFLLLEHIQMFEPCSRPRRPHHMAFHLQILSSCPDKCSPSHKQVCSDSTGYYASIPYRTPDTSQRLHSESSDECA